MLCCVAKIIQFLDLSLLVIHNCLLLTWLLLLQIRSLVPLWFLPIVKKSMLFLPGSVLGLVFFFYPLNSMANQIWGWLGSSGSQILGYFCEEGSMNYGPIRLDNPRPIDVIHIGVVNDSVGESLKENNWRHLRISDWDRCWNSWCLELEMWVSEVIDWSMRVTDCDTAVVNDRLQAWDYQSFGVGFGGPIGVSHWNLWHQ